MPSPGQLLCQSSITASAASLSVSAVFLVSVPLRLYALRHEHIKLQANWLGYMKLITSPALAITIIAQLAAVYKLSYGAPDTLEVVTICLSLVASIVFVGLSAAEHRLTVKPSSLIVLYLLATAGCDAFELTYPGPAEAAGMDGQTRAELTILAALARLVLLVLECLNKTSALAPKYRSLPPEETAGLLSKTFFWWLTDMLVIGTKRLLRIEDIPQLPTRVQGRPLRGAILKHWGRRDEPETSFTLLKTLARCLTTPALAPVVPRVCLVAFRCSQPVLIRQAMSFVSPTLQTDSEACNGYWVLVAAMVVYFGLAISTSLYRHRLNGLQVMIRGSLVTLVYDKSLNISSNVSDAGKVLTIMSTDIDGVSSSGEMFHETWAMFMELVIGMVLLAREVRWLWPVPLALIFPSRVSQYVAQNIRARQKGWNTATQARISTLSSVLGSMKSVKAMGLSGFLGDYVTGLRQKEIERSKHVRWMNVAYNASANAVGIFTPVITIVLFALIAALHHTRLDAKTAFTTIAILALVTHPANMIMTIVPRAVAAFANIERIQSYLLERSRVDQRKVSRGTSQAPETEGQPIAISLSDVTVLFDDSATPTLRGISMALPKGSATICSGPTGSGKSTLAKTILGEICPTAGEVKVSSVCIGYCDQKAWIPTGTVKEIVCAFEDKVDAQLYQDALRASCLDHDLERLPNGDATIIGSRGINLSGGQRQRLALARLLYSRPSIAVLDDPFSALDGNTENSVVDHLLGPDGWFRRAGITAFIISNSAQHFYVADRIILIENGTIKTQGPWEPMKARATEMQKFTFENMASEGKPVDADPSDRQRAAALANHDAEEDVRRKTGDLSLYTYYLKAAGVGNSILLVACTASYSFFITVPQYWFKWWTESEGNQTMFYVVGYILLAIVSWVSTNGIMWSTYILLAPRSGSRLHKALLAAVLGAPLSFFVSTDVGVILNRFSQDISLVDRQLPNAFSALCTQTFKMAMQVAILLQVQRMLLFTLPVCIIVVYCVQKAYLQTSRQLRVLELECHSALYSWFLETVDGIVSIRSFGWHASSTARNLVNLDYSLRPSYALFCLQCWLKLVLDLIVSFIAVAVIAIAVKWQGGTSQADVGLSLNLILVANTTLVRLVQSWASLEISLGAIARLKDAATNTPQEDRPGEDGEPDSSWPTGGNLQITQLSAGYDPEDMILKNINLNAAEGQKLVICGRTGSGKSTLVLGLLRLIESSGTIEVDGIALSGIPRSMVRHRCFITVSQDPFFLHEETLRFNLDPSGAASDEVLQSAMAKVGMWTRLCGNEGESDPLSRPLSSLPAVSAGQLQLLAMARAIVKKEVLRCSAEYRDAEDHPVAKPILLLDEATSSLDSTTESAIYDIIESEFTECGHTVVIVAHRIGVLSERMRSGRDYVAWIQDGRVSTVGSYEEFAQAESTSSPAARELDTDN